MRPVQLTLQAFGSYGTKTVIDFTRPNQNLFLVTGATGSGKTTIFDGIVFALYGEASSGSNRKDGTELQSQYVDYGVKPYVELVFSEYSGGEEKIYTVQRVPRHIRLLKKGSGTKEERESVSLTMPDGMEYSQNQKETDKKLEEIVGLTKSQFMQIAMIAQGEFMELLRADSNRKKEIFRKLFHTERYQKIVETLKDRRDTRQAEMMDIHRACQGEVSRILIPETYENGEKLAELKQRITVSDRLNVADMDLLMEELEQIGQIIGEQMEKEQEAYERAMRIRDQKRDACHSAQVLLDSYHQLEEAERELETCREEETEIGEAHRLMVGIQAAYEVQAAYERFSDADKRVADGEKSLNIQQDCLPGLEEREKKARQAADHARAERELQIERFTKISEKVRKNLEIAKKIRDGEQTLESRKNLVVSAEKAVRESRKALEDFEIQEAGWQKQVRELAEAEARYIQWESRNREADSVAEEVSSAAGLQADVENQRSQAERAGIEYVRAREAFEKANREFLEKQNAFFDAQAGFLAREKLVPGEPCPVCGSREHPSPCRLSEEHRELTRERIDELSAAAANCQKEQTKKSAEAGAAARLLKEKEEQFAQAAARLRERIEKNLSGVPDSFSIHQAEQMVEEWKEKLKEEERELRHDRELFQKVKSALEQADGEKQRLKDQADRKAGQLSDARTAFAAAEEALRGLQEQRDYTNEEEARAVLQEAEKEKEKKEEAYRKADRQFQEAKSELEQARTLIRKFQEELPGQREIKEQRGAVYQAVMEKHSLPEYQWQDMVSNHTKEEAVSLSEKINRHKVREAAARGAWNTAKQAIGDREKPVLEEVKAASDQAEASLKESQGRLEALREVYRSNEAVYRALSPKLEERRQLMEEFSRVDSLYHRLSGKITGARMDIETFVQRYYMQRVLYGANIRFRDMSAGQYELRMTEEAQAGEGKNRGLDLMVYSVVTGKEREVRTLSGGESFMAALSLALGMADQIQEHSAAVNLDIMFIDEGFGSLDDHSRNQAVKVLRQMAGGTKLIGIISHVSELKQEIENQLQVSKDETGSHVCWQIS